MASKTKYRLTCRFCLSLLLSCFITLRITTKPRNVSFQSSTNVIIDGNIPQRASSAFLSWSTATISSSTTVTTPSKTPRRQQFPPRRRYLKTTTTTADDDDHKQRHHHHNRHQRHPGDYNDKDVTTTSSSNPCEPVGGVYGDISSSSSETKKSKLDISFEIDLTIVDKVPNHLTDGILPRLNLAVARSVYVLGSSACRRRRQRRLGEGVVGGRVLKLVAIDSLPTQPVVEGDCHSSAVDAGGGVAVDPSLHCYLIKTGLTIYVDDDIRSKYTAKEIKDAYLKILKHNVDAGVFNSGVHPDIRRVTFAAASLYPGSSLVGNDNPYNLAAKDTGDTGGDGALTTIKITLEDVYDKGFGPIIAVGFAAVFFACLVPLALYESRQVQRRSAVVYEKVSEKEQSGSGPPTFISLPDDEKCSKTDGLDRGGADAGTYRVPGRLSSRARGKDVVEAMSFPAGTAPSSVKKALSERDDVAMKMSLPSRRLCRYDVDGNSYLQLDFGRNVPSQKDKRPSFHWQDISYKSMDKHRIDAAEEIVHESSCSSSSSSSMNDSDYNDDDDTPNYIPLTKDIPHKANHSDNDHEKPLTIVDLTLANLDCENSSLTTPSDSNARGGKYSHDNLVEKLTRHQTDEEVRTETECCSSMSLSKVSNMSPLDVLVSMIDEGDDNDSSESSSQRPRRHRRDSEPSRRHRRVPDRPVKKKKSVSFKYPS